MIKYYTMIGSRNTPTNVCITLKEIAKELYLLGYIGRSGGANGADQAMEDGHTIGVIENASIYLPWNNFNGKSSNMRGYINSTKLMTYEKAKEIASGVHPAWDKCKHGTQALHTRNVFQILGSSLKSPSDFVICYAEPTGTKGYVKGGTGTAVKIAIDNGIPVYNLWSIEVDNPKEFVKTMLGEIK